MKFFVPEGVLGHVILTHFDAMAPNLVEKLRQYGIPNVILVADLKDSVAILDLAGSPKSCS